MTIDNFNCENGSKRNRRTLSESDVRKNSDLPRNSAEISAKHFSVSNMEFLHQQRSHSLPHRYKNRTFSLTPASSPISRSNLRSSCYTPDEFRRGVQAMQSWFRNLDDNQRTLAFQSITVSKDFLEKCTFLD